MSTVRTRIAPSPTGEDLHIGNAYTALINWVFARKNNGQFIVRIEDTDRARLVPGSQERILSSLDWLGITRDAPVERQSERLEFYQTYAEELVAKGHAYVCTCTPERLDEMRKKQEQDHKPPMYDGTCRDRKEKKTGKYVIRLKVPKEGTTTFTDIIRGEISFENKLIDDQVILKSDGFPTYHLGVVVDDHLMGITHVIRGEEWISSTPKHILLYKFLGWDLPQYAHMPLLRNPDKSKLSKRKNPVWASWFREQGFLPEAVRNYLALMAWSYPDGRDVFTTEEMITVFDLSQIKTTAPVFDLEKLRWINGEYLRKKTDKELEALLPGRDKNLLSRIIPLIRDRMKTLSEFETLAGFFFERPKEFEKPLDAAMIATVKGALEKSAWSHDEMEREIRDASDKAGQKAKDVFMALRVAVTGKTVGPPLLESLEVLGREETLARL